jgi:hypothetical protein
VRKGADRAGSFGNPEHPLSATAIDAAMTAARVRERLVTVPSIVRPFIV